MRQPKITVSQLRAEADRLIASNKMPDLTTLLSVVAGVRQKYRPGLLETRRQANIHIVKSGEKHD